MDVTLKKPKDVLRIVHECLEYVEYESEPVELYEIGRDVHKYIDLEKGSEYWDKRNGVFVALLSFVKLLREQEDKYQHEQYLIRKDLAGYAEFCKDWKKKKQYDNARYEEESLAGRDETVGQELTRH